MRHSFGPGGIQRDLGLGVNGECSISLIVTIASRPFCSLNELGLPRFSLVLVHHKNMTHFELLPIPLFTWLLGANHSLADQKAQTAEAK